MGAVCGIHAQIGIPAWAEEFYRRADPARPWLKVMDPGDAEPLPEMPQAKVIVRLYEDEEVAQQEVLAGQPYSRYRRLEPELRRRPWLSKDRYYLTDMNEPTNALLLATPERRRKLDTFVAEYARILWSERGIRLCGYNLGVGHPEPGHVEQLFSKGLPAIKQHHGIWAVHEYGWPTMYAGEGWWVLRYRHTVAALKAAGIPFPDLVIGECGVDKLLVGEVGGWQSVDNNPAVFAEQLFWYLQELRKDPYVLAAFPFTSTPENTWRTYDFHEPLAMLVADWMAETSVPEPEEPVYEIIEACRAMPKNKDVTTAWPMRARALIRRTVIHHSVTEVPEDTPEAELQHLKNIARGHIRIANWWTIGYHYAVARSGRIYRLNPLVCVSNHVGGYNSTSVGVCMLGKLHKRPPSEEQMAATAWLVSKLGWRPVPHKALNQTACPGTWNWPELVSRVT